jgi:YHS domain-containing protein
MEGLSSFLIFAVFFYLMMRFGCGAHMMHGHHGHSKKAKADDVFDPVCGMKIGEEEGYGKLQNGVLFRFCSRKCLDEFEADPEKYISQSISKSLEEHRHDS